MEGPGKTCNGSAALATPPPPPPPPLPPPPPPPPPPATTTAPGGRKRAARGGRVTTVTAAADHACPGHSPLRGAKPRSGPVGVTDTAGPQSRATHAALANGLPRGAGTTSSASGLKTSAAVGAPYLPRGSDRNRHAHQANAGKNGHRSGSVRLSLAASAAVSTRPKKPSVVDSAQPRSRQSRDPPSPQVGQKNDASQVSTPVLKSSPTSDPASEGNLKVKKNSVYAVKKKTSRDSPSARKDAQDNGGAHTRRKEGNQMKRDGPCGCHNTRRKEGRDMKRGGGDHPTGHVFTAGRTPACASRGGQLTSGRTGPDKKASMGCSASPRRFRNEDLNSETVRFTSSQRSSAEGKGAEDKLHATHGKRSPNPSTPTGGREQDQSVTGKNHVKQDLAGQGSAAGNRTDMSSVVSQSRLALTEEQSSTTGSVVHCEPSVCRESSGTAARELQSSSVVKDGEPETKLGLSTVMEASGAPLVSCSQTPEATPPTGSGTRDSTPTSAHGKPNTARHSMSPNPVSREQILHATEETDPAESGEGHPSFTNSPVQPTQLQHPSSTLQDEISPRSLKHLRELWTPHTANATPSSKPTSDCPGLSRGDSVSKAGTSSPLPSEDREGKERDDEEVEDEKIRAGFFRDRRPSAAYFTPEHADDYPWLTWNCCIHVSW